MKLPKLNNRGFTVVEIVIGLAVIVALIGGGTLIYKRVRPTNPFKANASTYAFVYDYTNMSRYAGPDVANAKVDGVTYKVLSGSLSSIYSLVTASQLTNATKVCAHFRTFNTTKTSLVIRQLDTSSGIRTDGATNVSTVGTGNICTRGIYKGAGSIVVQAIGTNGSANVGIDTIYATL